MDKLNDFLNNLYIKFKDGIHSIYYIGSCTVSFLQNNRDKDILIVVNDAHTKNLIHDYIKDYKTIDDIRIDYHLNINRDRLEWKEHNDIVIWESMKIFSPASYNNFHLGDGEFIDECQILANKELYFNYYKETFNTEVSLFNSGKYSKHSKRLYYILLAMYIFKYNGELTRLTTNEITLLQYAHDCLNTTDIISCINNLLILIETTI